MRFTKPSTIEYFGNLLITSPVKTISLAGIPGRGEGCTHSMEEVAKIAERTAIIIPVKNEDLFLLGNTIRAIPEWSPVIVASASSLEPANVFRKEVEIARIIHEHTGKRIILIHQRDPAWSALLKDTPIASMLDSNGVVRYGKGEGMLLSAMVADWLGMEYLGFVDSDNYVPGAVYEYALLYYAGFNYLRHEYSMVRTVWSHKGKLEGSYEYGEEEGFTSAFIKALTGIFKTSDYYEKQVVLRRKGRVSQVVEEVLNYALSIARGVGTDIIRTPNSGEHALSVKLALNMKWAGGFAVETYELVTLLEECFIDAGRGGCRAFNDDVKILQAETINPHIHGEKGGEHLERMLAESLGAIYYSKLNNPAVSQRVKAALRMYARGLEPIKPRVYEPRGISSRKIIDEYFSSSKLAQVFE